MGSPTPPAEVPDGWGEWRPGRPGATVPRDRRRGGHTPLGCARLLPPARRSVPRPQMPRGSATPGPGALGRLLRPSPVATDRDGGRRPLSLMTARGPASPGRAGWSDVVRLHAVMPVRRRRRDPPRHRPRREERYVRHFATRSGGGERMAGLRRRTSEPRTTRVGSSGGGAAKPAAGARSSRDAGHSGLHPEMRYRALIFVAGAAIVDLYNARI